MSSKLLPKSIRDSLPMIATARAKESSELDVYIHYYNPVGPGDWFVVAGIPWGNDCLFYGLVFYDKPVMTDFSLKELKSKELPFNAKIMRNEHFIVKKLSEVLTYLSHS